MQLSRTFLINLLAITLLMGCSAEKDFFIISPLPKINNQFTPSIVWCCSVGNGSGEYYSQLSPAYDDSVVYAADRKGIIKAIDVYLGKTLWTIDLSQQISFFTDHLPILVSSGLTISGDKLYIGTETGKVIALNKINGKVKWKTDVAGEALSQPVVSDGLVLIHTSNGILQALDAHSGQNKWSINLDTSTFSVRGKSAPAISYGVAIIGSSNGRITAVMIAHGQIIWQQHISQIHGATEIARLHDINMSPVIDINSGIIFAIAYNGSLAAIDMYSNQIIWKQDLGSVNDIMITGNIIYLVDQNDCILAVSKRNGVILWIQDALLHRNLTAPIIYDGYLVVGDKKGYLHWLDVQNGKFVAQNKVNSSGLHSRLVIANNKLLLQAKDGTVYLIKR